MSAPHIFQETVSLIFFHAPVFEYQDLAFEETSEEKQGNKYRSFVIVAVFACLFLLITFICKVETGVYNESVEQGTKIFLS